MTLDLMADVLADTDSRLATLEQHVHDLTTRLDAPRLAQAILPDLALDDQVTMLLQAERPEQWCTDAAVRCLAAAWPDARQRLLLATAARRCGVTPGMLAGLVEQWQGEAAHAHDLVQEIPHGGGIKTMPIAHRHDIIPGWLPAGCTLVAGPAKSGKSLLMYHLAVAVGSGRPFLGHVPVQQGEVLYYCLEDGERRCRERLLHTEQQFPGLTEADLQQTYWKCWDAPRLGAGFERQTARWLDAHPTCRLVIVDILEKIRPLHRGAVDLYRAGYQATAPLTRLAQERNIALVVVHHTNKNPHSDPRLLVSGPMSLLGGADNAWVLKRPYGEPEAELHIAGRDLPDATYVLRFDAGVWRVRGRSAGIRLSEERADLLTILVEERQPMTAKQLAHALQKNASSVRSLLGKMLADGQVMHPRPGWYRPCLDPLDLEQVTPLAGSLPVHGVHSAAGTEALTPAREEEIPTATDSPQEDAGRQEDPDSDGDPDSTGDSGTSGDTDSGTDGGTTEDPDSDGDPANTMDTGEVGTTMDAPTSADAEDEGRAADTDPHADSVDTVDTPREAPDPFLEPDDWLTERATAPPPVEEPAHASPPVQTSSLPDDRPVQARDWIWPCLPSGAKTSASAWEVLEILTLPNGAQFASCLTATGKVNRWPLAQCQRAPTPEDA